MSKIDLTPRGKRIDNFGIDMSTAEQKGTTVAV